jgi:hypothetical protein
MPTLFVLTFAIFAIKIMNSFPAVKLASAKKRELPLLPPEIIDEILLCVGDVKLVNSLGRFSIMKHFLPKTYEEAMGKGILKAWNFLLNPAMMCWKSYDLAQLI